MLINSIWYYPIKKENNVVGICNRMAYIIEYIPDRKELLFWLPVSENRILCLFYTSDNWKNFLQTGFHTFRLATLYKEQPACCCQPNSQSLLLRKDLNFWLIVFFYFCQFLVITYTKIIYPISWHLIYLTFSLPITISSLPSSVRHFHG